MDSAEDRYHRSVQACIKNARRLLEDAEWVSNRASIGLALAMLAQEECAKAFLLALIRDGVLPWSGEIRRSLSVHECKHLLTVIMEWLMVVNERRLNELLMRSTKDIGTAQRIRQLPAEVATAMNIYRHEMIERLGKRSPGRYTEWRGVARGVAEGQHDRKKQRALYVSINEVGDVESLPPTSEEQFTKEFARAKALIEFANDVDGECPFARDEYELFADVFRSMFGDLNLDEAERIQLEERYPSDIPGVEFVQRIIKVAQSSPSETTGRS